MNETYFGVEETYRALLMMTYEALSIQSWPERIWSHEEVVDADVVDNRYTANDEEKRPLRSAKVFRPTKVELEELAMSLMNINSNDRRIECIRRYGFPMVEEHVINKLASYIGDTPVLEVCAGSSYLRKLLKYSGVNNITSTNISRMVKGNTPELEKYFVDIEPIDALDAIDKYHDQVEIIILAWPDLKESLPARILKKCLEKDLTMIYIGKEYGGYTTEEHFYYVIEHDCTIDPLINDHYCPFWGIHDDIYIIRKRDRDNDEN